MSKGADTLGCGYSLVRACASPIQQWLPPLKLGQKPPNPKTILHNIVPASLSEYLTIILVLMKVSFKVWRHSAFMIFQVHVQFKCIGGELLRLVPSPVGGAKIK